VSEKKLTFLQRNGFFGEKIDIPYRNGFFGEKIDIPTGTVFSFSEKIEMFFNVISR
jgi:hypothetical protein